MNQRPDLRDAAVVFAVEDGLLVFVAQHRLDVVGGDERVIGHLVKVSSNQVGAGLNQGFIESLALDGQERHG